MLRRDWFCLLAFATGLLGMQAGAQPIAPARVAPDAVKGIRMGVNYGLNKLRFPGPVRVGKRVRLTATLVDYEEIANGAGAQATIGLSFEVEGESKPGCVAEALYRYYA